MPDSSRDPQPGQLHHVELYCSDLDASLGFWEWLLSALEYSLYQDWDGGRSYRLGPTYIVFVQVEDDHAAESYHRCRPGLNHLAFHAHSRSHVDELTDQIRDREDATILYPEEHPYAGGEDHYALYCEDPERIKVEIVAPT